MLGGSISLGSFLINVSTLQLQSLRIAPRISTPGLTGISLTRPRVKAFIGPGPLM